MRRILFLFIAVFTDELHCQPCTTEFKAGCTKPAPAPIPAEAIAKVNPVKSTPEGLEWVKKLYGYHCSMCHGKDGDGKGELAEQMKLTLNDWRNPASISKMTDGELFYIITNGRGKMTGGEGDRTKEETRWQLVNYVKKLLAPRERIPLHPSRLHTSFDGASRDQGRPIVLSPVLYCSRTEQLTVLGRKVYGAFDKVFGPGDGRENQSKGNECRGRAAANGGRRKIRPGGRERRVSGRTDMPGAVHLGKGIIERDLGSKSLILRQK